MKLDDIHFNSSKIDGYQKTFNYIISPREDGKTTWFWVTKFWKTFKKTGGTTLVLRRTIRDCTKAYVESIRAMINLWVDEEVKFEYNSSELAEGLCYIYIGDKLAIVILAMWLPKERFKSNVIPHLRYIFMEEFIVDVRDGEKYLPNEAFKLQEIYSTFYRWADDGVPVIFYAVGNPYSLYIPLIDQYGIDTQTIAKRGLITGTNWLIDYHQLNPLLRAKLLEKNPLYKFGEDYFKYALEGIAINDANIWVEKSTPANFTLDYVLVFGKANSLVIYQGDGTSEQLYHIERVSKEEGKRRQRFALDLAMVDKGAKYLSFDERRRTQSLKMALFRGAVSFSDAGAYYLLEEAVKRI